MPSEIEAAASVGPAQAPPPPRAVELRRGGARFRKLGARREMTRHELEFVINCNNTCVLLPSPLLILHQYLTETMRLPTMSLTSKWSSTSSSTTGTTASSEPSTSTAPSTSPRNCPTDPPPSSARQSFADRCCQPARACGARVSELSVLNVLGRLIMSKQQNGPPSPAEMSPAEGSLVAHPLAVRPAPQPQPEAGEEEGAGFKSTGVALRRALSLRPRSVSWTLAGRPASPAAGGVEAGPTGRGHSLAQETVVRTWDPKKRMDTGKKRVSAVLLDTPHRRRFLTS